MARCDGTGFFGTLPPMLRVVNGVCAIVAHEVRKACPGRALVPKGTEDETVSAAYYSRVP